MIKSLHIILNLQNSTFTAWEKKRIANNCFLLPMMVCSTFHAFGTGLKQRAKEEIRDNNNI